MILHIREMLDKFADMRRMPPLEKYRSINQTEGFCKMLILTRRVGETIMIGDEVTITVLGVKGNQVRIGVNAPKSVAVHREEIYERIKREKQGDTKKPGDTNGLSVAK